MQIAKVNQSMHIHFDRIDQLDQFLYNWRELSINVPERGRNLDSLVLKKAVYHEDLDESNVYY